MSRFARYALALAALALAGTARATDCSTLPGQIYVAGMAPGFIPMLATDLAGADVTLIFSNLNDCTGLQAILPPGAGGVPLQGVASTWDSMGKQDFCDLPSGGLTPDVAITGLYPATCAAALGLVVPSNLAAVPGPTIPYAFVTPAGAGAPSAISAEQAYYVFGYGYFGGIAPWDMNQQVLNILFAPGQATLDVSAGAIGVAPGSFIGTIVSGTQAMLDGVTSVSPATSAIGMLSSDVYEVNLAKVTPLAFRGYGQDFAWTPDALGGGVDGGFDGRNVREGRYALSGETHFLFMTGDGGLPQTSGGQTFLDILGGSTDLVDLNQITIADHLVPECAMHYERSVDGYDPTLHYGFAPSTRKESCDCYFDSQIGSTTCQRCSGSCPGGGVCRRGYCEAF